jgi:uncharacterized protein YneF (UPF0154 family)
VIEMNKTAAALLSRTVALAFGLLWGFFVAFNVVFSDIFGSAALAGAVAFVFAAYLALGFGFGVVGRRSAGGYTGWLATPGGLFALLMLGDNPARIIYTLAVVIAVVGGTMSGVWLGALTRRWRDSRGRPPAIGKPESTG